MLLEKQVVGVVGEMKRDPWGLRRSKRVPCCQKPLCCSFGASEALSLKVVFWPLRFLLQQTRLDVIVPSDGVVNEHMKEAA